MQFLRFPVLLSISAAFAFVSLDRPLGAATVGGTVTIPASPTGWTPGRGGMRVRVQGTDLAAAVDAGTGAFSLENVPAGAVTLLLVEPAGQDVFTQASKRTALSVSQDLSDAGFDLQYHWQRLAAYPPVWRTPGYESWEIFFVSDQVGYILFRINGPPDRMELYRTADGGANWSEVGHWEKDDAQYAAGNQTFPSADTRMFFGDAAHGVVLASRACLPCGCNTGFLRTDDGGTTWTIVDLPLVETAYNVNIDRFAAISAAHWIAAGWIGCYVQGYGAGYHNAIWETTDAGATWQVAETYAGSDGCTGLAANADGDAICFRTPYGSGVRKASLRSGSTGVWTTTDNSDIVANSGYGPADVVMLGDTAWVVSDGGGLADGLYRSTQAGAIGSWTPVSDSLVQYMDFGGEFKAFGLFGGPAHVSYDGGATWLLQSRGGGLCCHGNDIFAFDTVRAIWRDRGAGDPDGLSSILTYAEPWVANFEVLAGASLPDRYVQPGESQVPIASFAFTAHGPVPVQVNAFTLRAAGTGSEPAAVSAVKLWLDTDKDGLVGVGDALLAEGGYTADDGTIGFTTGTALTLNQFDTTHVLVTYDLEAAIPTGKTFTCSLAVADIDAETADTHQAIDPTAPAGQAIAGRTLTTAELVLADDFENGLGGWTAGTEDPQPDAGYGWRLSTELSPSSSTSAYIREDRNHDGWNVRHYLTLTNPLDLSGDGSYQLAFNEWYSIDPSLLLHVQASTDDGATWHAIQTIGNSSRNASGGWLQKVYALDDLTDAPAVTLRFQLDWTSGWYFNAAWSVDDVRIYRLPPAPPEPDPGGEDTGNNGGTTPTPGGTGSADPESQHQNSTGNAPPIAAPLCGFGMLEAMGATMLTLLVVRRRR